MELPFILSGASKYFIKNLRARVGPRGMSLRQGQVRLGAHAARIPVGAQAVCIALNWPYGIAFFLVRGLQILYQEPRSKGGPKGYVLEARQSQAEGTRGARTGGGPGCMYCSEMALWNCFVSCQGPPNTSSRT